MSKPLHTLEIRPHYFRKQRLTLVTVSDGTLVYVGTAICSQADQWSRKGGYEPALRLALGLYLGVVDASDKTFVINTVEAIQMLRMMRASQDPIKTMKARGSVTVYHDRSGRLWIRDENGAHGVWAAGPGDIQDQLRRMPEPWLVADYPRHYPMNDAYRLSPA